MLPGLNTPTMSCARVTLGNSADTCSQAGVRYLRQERWGGVRGVRVRGGGGMLCTRKARRN